MMQKAGVSQTLKTKPMERLANNTLKISPLSHQSLQETELSAKNYTSTFEKAKENANAELGLTGSDVSSKF